MTRSSNTSKLRRPHRRTGNDVPLSVAEAVTAGVDRLLDVTDWADDEIGHAGRRHPDNTDLLYHAFALLRPRDLRSAMLTEFVYRAHAGELLDRVAAGADTRPATAAELCVVCAQVSQRIPMHGAAAGLYFRLWQLAFPNHPATTDQSDQQVHYESLFGPRIDDLEQELRHRVADPQRRLIATTCAGRHHGRTVACRFAARA